MNRKQLWIVIMVTLLTFCGTSLSVLGQATGTGKAAPQGPQAQSRMITIQGKIDHMESMGGYFIQGQKPREIFTILNQNPEVLGKLAKSGQVVTIEAKVVQGDNILIESIGGKKYVKPAPAPK